MAKDWLEQHYSEKVCFPQIDPKAYKEQLLTRIYQPKLINQGLTDFCGPAAVLHNIAKYYPLEYAQFAWGLFQSGNAMIFGNNFTIGALNEAAIHQNEMQQKLVVACDWLTMAAVRMHMSVFGSLTTLRTTYVQGTDPGDVMWFLKSVGFTVVNNCLSNFSNMGWDVDKDKELHLKGAIQLLERGVNIILSVKSFMFKPDKLDEAFFKPDHWCTLKSARITDAEVICRVWHHGQPYNFDKQSSINAAAEKLKHVSQEDAGKFLNEMKALINVKLPKSKFFRFYFGYLAVGDPNPNKIIELS